MLKRIAGLGVPMLFLMPVIGFVTSLFNIRSKTNAFVYVAFGAIFGYSISFSDPSADSYRYAIAFNNFDNTLDYNAIVQMYQNGELRDMYRVLLFYICSIFTSNPKVMYALAGTIYGLLSYKAMLVLANSNGKKLDVYTFVLSLVFFTYVSLANINGFRFWTGALMFFYASYQHIIVGNKKWLIGLLVTPLFHYGFIMALPLVLLYKVIGRFFYTGDKINNGLFILFCLTFVTSFVLGTNSINLAFLTQSDALSGAIGERLEYVNSDSVAKLVDNRRDESVFLSVQTYFDYAIKVFVFIGVVYMRNLLNRMTGNKSSLVQLFTFVLYFFSFAFIAVSFPSGGRFFNITLLFFVVLLSRFYRIYKAPSIKKLILFMLPTFAFHILFVNFMLPYMILTPTFWYGNFFWILLEGWGFKP